MLVFTICESYAYGLNELLKSESYPKEHGRMQHWVQKRVRIV